MSTLVQVKEEQTGDVYCVETDSESDEGIDADYLQPLGPKLALLSKYPIGCKVLCNLRRLPVSSHLKAKMGSVQEVYIHFENGKRVYKVKTCALTENEIILYEEQLTYAINCPVTVANADADGTRTGIVVYLEREKGSDGKQQLTYAVQFEEGDYMTIESGVDAKRIKYKVPDCCVGGVKDPVTDEEEKDEEVRSQTSSTESSSQVDTKASIGSDSIPPSSSAESSAHVVANDRRVSLDANKEKPPPVLQRKREHDFESSVNQRPNKAVKREEVKIEANNDRVEINNENECVLTIPSWWMGQWGKENRKRLFSKSPMTKASSYSNYLISLTF